ncbi:hypothetical protein UH38_10220 [Aliterella atlantica CENA595]|uniref:Uncharacterized protein n=1 Tax=Aliterella atlantica CENA595 TaxID=1618023 RepID=A0A0D8ZSM6_9CYAN|nr:hypothetical protein UH38_10220 [Aliterella atlantica CENA595]
MNWLVTVIPGCLTFGTILAAVVFTCVLARVSIGWAAVNNCTLSKGKCKLVKFIDFYYFTLIITKLNLKKNKNQQHSTPN